MNTIDTTNMTSVDVAELATIDGGTCGFTGNPGAMDRVQWTPFPGTLPLPVC